MFFILTFAIKSPRFGPLISQSLIASSTSNRMRYSDAELTLVPDQRQEVRIDTTAVIG